MNTEIELKLAVTPQALPLLQQYLNQFNLLENKTVFLKNTYYDYPDNFLAQQKMGLRVRCENDQRTLTLKTDGDVRGGLHLRPEYDLPLAENESPTTERLNTLYPFRDLPQAPLVPIFSTDLTALCGGYNLSGHKLKRRLIRAKLFQIIKRNRFAIVNLSLKRVRLMNFSDLLPICLLNGIFILAGRVRPCGGID